MRVTLKSTEFTEITISSGTIQNVSPQAPVEIASTQTEKSGILLLPYESLQYGDNATVYARGAWGADDVYEVAVEPFKRASGGGEYNLPIASASKLGGIKVGNNLSIDADTGVLSATGGGGGYVLPPATASTLGGVIIGDNVTVDANGEISVAAPYSLPPATASTLGGVIVGDNISVDANGEISTHAPYSLPAATSSTLGGVIVGDNISVDANGEISTHAPYTLPAATASTLGGVSIGANITVDANGEISTHAPYSLPTAAADTLGGVKIGSNITIDGNGAISAPAAYTLPTAAANTLGGIKIGQNLFIDANGVLSAATPSTDPVGRVVYDVILRTGYIKANGATVADASTSVPNLLQFVQDNSATLLAANQAAYDANVGLYLYDSGTDALTLPNYTGRVMQGGNSVESVAAGLPNIKGTLDVPQFLANNPNKSVDGALDVSYGGQSSLTWSGGNGGKFASVVFNAHSSNAIYDDTNTTVQPPAIKMIPQIKY